MSDSKKKSGRYHHGDLRNALIEAGLTILEEEGVHALTLRRLARQANVSHAAPYRHFEDKSQLLAAIALQGFEMLAAGMEKIIKDYPNQVSERLLNIGIAYVHFGMEHPAHLTLMFGPLVDRSLEGDALHQASSYTYELLINTVREAQASGDFRSGDPEVTARSLWVTVHGLAMLAKDGQLHDMGENRIEQVTTAVKETMAQLMSGLRAPA